MLRWRIYYGDESTSSDQDGPPELAPARDVQIIVCNDPSGIRGAIYRHEWYWFVDGEPYGGSAEDLHDHLMNDRERRVHGIKKARSTPCLRFNAIKARALSDPDFPLPS